jgi:precorrin-6Y C5,15-methyltransferase (decarboxylating)
MLPTPNAIFIGGSGGNLRELIDYAWNALTDKGKLVVSAVTDESKQILHDFAEQQVKAGIHDEWVHLQVTKNSGPGTALRELKPVSLLKCVKSQLRE